MNWICFLQIILKHLSWIQGCQLIEVPFCKMYAKYVNIVGKSSVYDTLWLNVTNKLLWRRTENPTKSDIFNDNKIKQCCYEKSNWVSYYDIRIFVRVLTISEFYRSRLLLRIRTSESCSLMITVRVLNARAPSLGVSGSLTPSSSSAEIRNLVRWW